MKSINQPWAISDKYAQRYGALWTNLDFTFNDKISAENFKTDPMNTEIGSLKIAGQDIKMRYKDLLSYSKQLDTYAINVYASRPKKTDTFTVEIKGRNFVLAKHEIGKLSETLTEAAKASLHAYEIGLYL
jgi:hypothetical protein